MGTTRYFEGFIDLHPSYQVNCDICSSDIAIFSDIDTFEDICLDCCDDIWYARIEIKSLNFYADKWKAS